MRLFKLTTLLCLLIFFVTGCSTSMESPEELIKDSTIYKKEKKELYDGIKKLLSPGKLILPSNLKEVGQINEIDLNEDGVNEVVAFEKKENLNTNKRKVGFIVLSKTKDNTYTSNEESMILEDGDSIEYANFYDLDSDKNKEIVLLIKEGNKTNMNIYRFIDGKINKIYTLNPTWIEDKENLLDMKIKIDYINNDNILDILIFNLNSKTNEMYVSVTNFKENIEFIDYVKFDNVKNISDLYIRIGNIATSKKGIILDIPTFKENSYITQMIYVNNNKLEKIFKDDDENIMKPYYIPVDDLDKDKVIDIPIVNGNSNTYTSKSSANISWYRWNKKLGENSGLLLTSQIYYNYQYNYKFLIPNNLVNKIYIEQEYNNENVVFKFYYYDIVDVERKSLFSISTSSKTIGEENKNIANPDSIILRETEASTFLLTVDNLEELDKLDITTEALREYFSLIYE